MNIVRDHRGSIGKLFDRTRSFIGEMNRIADATRTIGLNRAFGGVELWRPTTDVFTRGEDLVVHCDLVGVRPEDVNIIFTTEHLTITGTERPEPVNDTAHRIASRTRGDFRCDITLAPEVTYDDVQAIFDDGTLEITLTGAARPRPSQETLIPINITEKVPSPRDPVTEETKVDLPQQV